MFETPEIWYRCSQVRLFQRTFHLNLLSNSQMGSGLFRPHLHTSILADNYASTMSNSVPLHSLTDGIISSPMDPVVGIYPYYGPLLRALPEDARSFLILLEYDGNHSRDPTSDNKLLWRFLDMSVKSQRN